MPTILTCPACGAPLEVQAGKKIVRCKFCQNEVAVPEAGADEALSGSLPAGLDMNQLMKLRRVRDMAREGRTHDASLLYRRIVGCTAEEAEQAVGAMAAGRPVVLTSVTQSKPVVTETTFSGSPEEVVDQIEDFFDGQTGPGMKEAGEALKKLLSGKTGE